MKINWRAGCWETSTSGSMGGGWKSTGYPTDTWQLAGRLPDGLHLTDTLLLYPGPAIVVDPKLEQYKRTAAYREQLGPVYCLPGHQLELAGYYRQLLDRDDVIELHYQMIRPWLHDEPIFAEKSLFLFRAVGLFAQAHGLDPIRLLLDLAESNPVRALAALRTVEAAAGAVDAFTNGAPPNAYHEDKFVTSALGHFSTRLFAYQKYVDTIAPTLAAPRGDLLIPPDWAQRNGTIYILFTLDELQAAAGIVAVLLAGLLRYQLRLRRKEPMLVAIDETPAVGLHNLPKYLAEVGDLGINLLLYAQGISQLKALYGQDHLRTILINCPNRVWYPAGEEETAEMMSTHYGETMRAIPAYAASTGTRPNPGSTGGTQTSHNQNVSWSFRREPLLGPKAMMALPREEVLVEIAAQERQYVFLGRRLDSSPHYAQWPLRLPRFRPELGLRHYTDWAALAAAPPAQTNNPAADKPPGQATGSPKAAPAASIIEAGESKPTTPGSPRPLTKDETNPSSSRLMG